jgi:hypothetical protein
MRKMFHVVAYNANQFSALWATAQKTFLISIHVWFSALFPTPTLIISPRCGPHRGKKIICVVPFTAEKWSA